MLRNSQNMVAYTRDVMCWRNTYAFRRGHKLQ